MLKVMLDLHSFIYINMEQSFRNAKSALHLLMHATLCIKSGARYCSSKRNAMKSFDMYFTLTNTCTEHQLKKTSQRL